MKTDKLKKAEPVEKKIHAVEVPAVKETEPKAVAPVAEEKTAAKPTEKKTVKTAEEKTPAKPRTRKTAAAKTVSVPKEADKTEPAEEKAAVPAGETVPAPVAEIPAAPTAQAEKKPSARKTTARAAKASAAKAAAKAEKPVNAESATQDTTAAEQMAKEKTTKRTAAKKAVKVAEEKKPVAAKKTKAAPAKRTAGKAKKEDAFTLRMAARRSQLQELYLQQFAGDDAGFAYLEGMLRTRWEERSEALRALDESRSANWYQSGAHLVLTMCAQLFAGTLNGVREKLDYVRELDATILRIQDLLEEIPGAGMSYSGLVRPQLGADEDLAALAEACRKEGISLGVDIAMDYTGDTHPWTAGDDGRYHQNSRVLNYGTPITFNDMASGLLRLANSGVEMLFLNGLDRMAVADHQSQTAMVRLLRIIFEIVCPSVVLVGEGGKSFLGTEEAPACHLVSGTDAAVWHTLATGDVSLLRHGVGTGDSRRVNSLLGCRGLRWDLDFAWLAQQGMRREPHIRYLNEYYTGVFKGSDGRGILRDGALWGTAASLCGVEAADFEQNALKLEQSAARLNLLYGWLLTEGGIPSVQSGDEIGQLNDYNDHSDPYLSDAAVVCRGSFSWPLAEMRSDSEMRQGKHYQPLHRALEAWKNEPAFRSDAKVWTEDTGNRQVLAVLRQAAGHTVAALFNFGGCFVTVGIDRDGAGEDLVYGVRQEDLRNVTLYPYSFAWLLLEDK